MTSITEPVAPSAWRAWCFLVWLSFQRQARAHLMVWIALGLLGLTSLIVAVNTQADRWTVGHWRHPRRGPTFAEYADLVANTSWLPWQGPDAAGPAMAAAGINAALYQASGFFVFSDFVVFAIYATFLLPLWSISFATE